VKDAVICVDRAMELDPVSNTIKGKRRTLLRLVENEVGPIWRPYLILF